MTTYRRSALAAAALRMWRGWSVIIPVVIANAGLQAILAWPGIRTDDDAILILLALVSAAGFIVSLGFVTASALLVSDGRVGWSRALGVMRPQGLLYSVWAIALGAAVIVGLAFYTVPALLVVALTPFLLLAALDGRRNALGANFRTIGRRFWRWLVTVVVVAVGVLLGWVLAGLTGFFLRGALASLVVWLVAGFAIAWITTAWAVIYRSAWADREAAMEEEPDPPEMTPDLESAE